MLNVFLINMFVWSKKHLTFIKCFCLINKPFNYVSHWPWLARSETDPTQFVKKRNPRKKDAGLQKEVEWAMFEPAWWKTPIMVTHSYWNPQANKPFLATRFGLSVLLWLILNQSNKEKIGIAISLNWFTSQWLINVKCFFDQKMVDKC